jgi:hypothetical protein
MKQLYYSVLLLFCLSVAPLSAQVLINEVSHTNASINNNEVSQPEDWIELYNAGSSSVNLDHYSISKTSGKEWHFPSMTIYAHSYLVLLASGRDTIISGVFRHISFKISGGDYKLTLKNSMGAEIDEYYIQPALQTDNSYGRNPDGSSNWCFFKTPTPNASNNSSACYAGYEPAPVISSNGGFFGGPQTISVSSATGQVHYTVDGSIPSATSPVYTGPVTLTSTKVLATRTFSTSGLLPSPVVKKTFFISESNIDVPIFSLTIDSLDLFDSLTGMYVDGPAADTALPHYGANYWKDIEKPCYIEYFDKNKIKQFGTPAGLKIFGGYSRAFAQKSFKVKCRAHYGTPEVNCSLIPEKKYINSYRDIILRNGGTDNGGTHFRDAFMQRLLKKQHVDYMAYEPAVVYLNGNFWGFYEIREREDEAYLEKNMGYTADQVDFLEHSGLIYTIAGSDTGFYNMYNYITTANSSSPGYYSHVGKMLDIENFCDYFIAETYYGNKDWLGDWVNNIKLWRPRMQGGKWRYILWDLDFGMGLYSSPYTNYLDKARYPFMPNEHSDMFDALLNNTEFKNYFVNRYADLINTVYTHRNVHDVAYEMRDEVNSIMAMHFNKWGGTYSAWSSAISGMMDFNEDRREHARNHIVSEFNLNGQVDVDLDVMPAGAGKIRISTIVPDSLPWTGVYFDGVPVKITALPNPGYKFTYWTSNTGEEEKNISFEKNISSDDKFTAHFEMMEFGLEAYPNPGNDQVTVSYELPEDSEVSLKLYSVMGNEVMDVVAGSMQKGGRHTVPFSMKGAGLANGLYIMKIEAGENSKAIMISKE